VGSAAQRSTLPETLRRKTKVKIDNFFAELKRRNVYKVAVAYAVASWLIIQIATQVFPFFEVPNWAVRLVVLLLILGFPAALIFSWAFEITPEGIKRESEVGPATSISRKTGRKIVGLTVALAAVAAAMLMFQLLRPKVASTSISKVESTVANIPAKSIAVLPFENLSRDPDNAYFVDGTQDEILTRLAKISALKVISRTSTTRYTSHPDNLRQIARELGVANILEGSVQRAEGAVRVNVQLIEAETDSHLWAETYDRDIKNIFSVESEIAQNVADALRARLLPEETARVANVPTKNSEAYDLFLKAEYFANQLYSSTAKDPAETARNAAALYENAVGADPNFALAYARLAYLKARIYWYNTDPSPQAIDAARKAAERALALQPELAEAHLSMGYVHYWGRRDYDAALAEFDKARKTLPNSANVLTAIAFVHRRQAKMEQALDELERSAALDPRYNLLAREIGSTFVYIRHYAEANPAYDRALALVPDDFETQVYRVTMLEMSGDLDAAKKALAMIPVDIDPAGSVSFARWHLALAMHQPDAALAALDRAPAWLLSIWPNSREPVALLRAQALVQKGEVGPARAAFLEAEQALEGLLAKPRAQADAQSYLALVYAGLGQREAALESGRLATQNLPASRDVIVGGSYLTQLAMAEAQVGEKQSALNHIEQLLTIPAGHALSRASLRVDPVWDPLRSDPRFQKLCEEKPK
jgi:TolB-like protein/Tfp pilus assembly protein PilF